MKTNLQEKKMKRIAELLSDFAKADYAGLCRHFLAYRRQGADAYAA